jgi:hypothetical protein
MWTRFEEHCRVKDKTPLHQDIQEIGYLNFSLEELEKVDYELLDEREKYWINYYDTFYNGYNRTIGGRGIHSYKRVKSQENGFVFESATSLARLIEEESGWNKNFIRGQIKASIETGKDFLSYHFIDLDTNEELTPEDEVRNWVKTLQIRFCGKHIYCNELEMEFETIAACGRYLLDNNLYFTNSKYPLQSLVTAIGKQLHGATQYIQGINTTYTFNFMPGTTKQTPTSEVAVKRAVYCPQLDKTFESQIEAARYFIDNGIWPNIKLKTAKLRISNVVCGNFPDYKGYTFQAV